jgi:phosphoglycolate phosphatase
MRLVIFDCDGTLVDSQAIIVAAMNRAFEAKGLAPPSRQATLSIVGLSLKEAMRALMPEASEAAVIDAGEAYRDAYVAFRRDGAHHDALYPGAREALAALAGRDGLVLGIATGKSRRGVDALLKRERFEGVFATIQTADDAPSKPHPAMVLQAMAETGAEPGATAMIGDTAYDMAMARAARAGAIGVTWGYHPRTMLVDAGSQALVDRFADLEAAIDALTGAHP